MGPRVSGRQKRKQTTPWQRRRRRALFVVGLLGVIVLCWLFWRLDRRSELGEAMEAAVALGVPLTESAYHERFGPERSYWLDKEPLAPDSPYIVAMKSYVLPTMEIFQGLPNFNGRTYRKELLQIPYGETTLKAMRDLVGLNREALALLHEATQAGAPLPHGHHYVPQIVGLLCSTACVRAHEGDVDGAFQAIDDAFVVLRNGDRNTGPDGGVLVDFDPSRSLLHALESALVRIRFTETQLATFQEHLVSGDWIAFRKEQQIRQMSHFVIDSSYIAGGDERILNLFTGWVDRYRAHELSVMNFQYKMIGKSLHEQDKVIAANNERGYEYYLRPILPHVSFLVFHAALDIVRYDGVHGSLPPSLEVLVPEIRESVPTDPWSDGPLRYTADGRSLLVYSVGGWDRSDNGGDSRKDIVVQLTLPAAP